MGDRRSFGSLCARRVRACTFCPCFVRKRAALYTLCPHRDPSVPPPKPPFPTVNRFQLLDAYVGLNFSNWQITFGPQTLWWGPSLGGPLMFNDNAAPVNMLRINRVSPFKLPWLLSWLGPWRMEWFLGQLSGHDFVFQTNTGIVGQFGVPLTRQPFWMAKDLVLSPCRILSSVCL